MRWSESILFAISFLHTFSSLFGKHNVGKPSDSKYDWDFLIFTQRWPMTACSQWQDAGSNNTCAFPNPSDLWTIHGIWPTKLGTKGPGNCNNTWHFNETQIQPIELELEQYWTNVEKNTKLTSLWKHEWSKHGTCAAVLPELNNEFKYFNQGLLWLQQYNMKFILSQKGIVPNNKGYLIDELFHAVNSVLNKSCVIECVVDRHTKQSLISEIRICFDKSLNLIVCASRDHMRIGNILTNCNPKKVVMYPKSLDPYTTTSTTTTTMKTTKEAIRSTKESTINSLIDTEEHLLTLYRTIKLLIWVTL